jgi:hypothetical protein
MDGLFERLRRSGIGCRMGNQYVGGLGYADDLTLLVPSHKGLQIVINICEEYAAEYDVLFNGAKSQFLIFKGRDCTVRRCSVIVNNVPLFNIDKAVHLGHSISTINKDSLVSAAIAHFWRSFNMFSADFGHIYPYLQSKLFKQYCCCFYGATLWLLTSQIIKRLCSAWRRALRKMWRLSPMTHCNIITVLSGIVPLEVSLRKRFCKFSAGVTQHKSKVIKTVAIIARTNPFSVFCENYVQITNECDCIDLNKCRSMIEKKWYDNVSDELISNASVLNDMIDIRDGRKKCENLDAVDVNDIIEDICLN